MDSSEYRLSSLRALRLVPRAVVPREESRMPKTEDDEEGAPSNQQARSRRRTKERRETIPFGCDEPIVREEEPDRSLARGPSGGIDHIMIVVRVTVE